MLTSLRGTVFDVKRSYDTRILWSAKTPSVFELTEGESVSGLVRRGVVPEADTSALRSDRSSRWLPVLIVLSFWRTRSGFAHYAFAIITAMVVGLALAGYQLAGYLVAAS